MILGILERGYKGIILNYDGIKVIDDSLFIKSVLLGGEELGVKRLELGVELIDGGLFRGDILLGCKELGVKRKYLRVELVDGGLFRLGILLGSG